MSVLRSIESKLESLFEGVLPPRTGGPTPKKIGEDVEEGVPADVEPDADEGGRQPRPGPAPQPA